MKFSNVAYFLIIIVALNQKQKSQPLTKASLNNQKWQKLLNQLFVLFETSFPMGYY